MHRVQPAQANQQRLLLLSTAFWKLKRDILTIEDPIEFELQALKNSIIHQREVKRDTQTFAAALRAALREDPDVIYIGEMRDLETIQLAIVCRNRASCAWYAAHIVSRENWWNELWMFFRRSARTSLPASVNVPARGISQTLCKNSQGKRSSLRADGEYTCDRQSDLERENQSDLFALQN